MYLISEIASGQQILVRKFYVFFVCFFTYLFSDSIYTFFSGVYWTASVKTLFLFTNCDYLNGFSWFSLSSIKGSVLLIFCYNDSVLYFQLYLMLHFISYLVLYSMIYLMLFSDTFSYIWYSSYWILYWISSFTICHFAFISYFKQFLS